MYTISLLLLGALLGYAYRGIKERMNKTKDLNWEERQSAKLIALVEKQRNISENQRALNAKLASQIDSLLEENDEQLGLIEDLANLSQELRQQHERTLAQFN